MRFRFEKDRHLCLGAGLLLACALRRAGASDLSLHCLSNGKPELAIAQNLHFNLSHSGTLAVCAVSDQSVGVDVEVIQRADPGVVAMCFQPSEQAWLNRSDDPCRAFTRLWTRKESYLKLLGTGLSHPLDSFAVLPAEKTPDGVAYYEKKIAGHLLCVCAPQDGVVIFKECRIGALTAFPSA